MKKRWPVIFASVLAVISLAALARFVIHELRWKALDDSFEPAPIIGELPLAQAPETDSSEVVPLTPDEIENIDAEFSLQVPGASEDIDPGLSIPAPAENIDPDMTWPSNDDSDIIVVVPFDSAEADGTNSIIVAPDGDAHCAA